MNARQCKKQLKKRINCLERDNELMRKIIDNAPQMAELYDVWNKSVK